jgi:hypothetical protein
VQVMKPRLSYARLLMPEAFLWLCGFSVSRHMETFSAINIGIVRSVLCW